MGSAMVPLGRALLTSCRLFVVTIPLSVTVWPQFAMQILTGSLTVKFPLSWTRLIQCYLYLAGTRNVMSVPAKS